MSTSCGFFNSLNHDRRYDASVFGQCFEGIILDGILASIGDCFAVKANSGMTVTVGPGKSWYLNSWLKNDADLPVTLDDSDVVLGRIDAIVMEFDATESVRWNDIKIVKGIPSSVPVRPVLKDSKTVKQVPLTFIAVRPNAQKIVQADITNMVGTSACPFVTGILETIDIDVLIAQWKSQWNTWFEAQTAESDSEVSDWVADRQAKFDEWFGSLQDILSGDTAAKLADRILGVENKVDNLITCVSVVLPTSGWSGNIQTVAVPGLTASAGVIVAPNPSDDSNFESYTESGIRCIAQTAENLTFKCEGAPSVDVVVNVEIHK